VISGDDAFKNFTNFQGFVERMYSKIPDIMKHTWVSSFNWGEDEVVTIGSGEYLFAFSVDRGNYRDYINNGNCFLDRTPGWNADLGARGNPSIWRDGWENIRTANMGLEALANGKMTDASQDERDMITGQLYFLRAWNYFQITKYWGGMPYIETVLPSDEAFRLPRETYKENAEKMAADFRRAADLLPIDWDETEIGSRTKDNNELRANKIWALAYLGKTYLYAGSPLMANGINASPTAYDADMCKKSADAFGELLTLVVSGQTQYELVDFTKYSNLFYTIQQDWMLPGSTEAIVRNMSVSPNASFWRQMNSYQIAAMAQGDNIILHPAANYVNYFGMADGMPLDDPDTTFDKTHPWKGRDPRFYYNFIYDGVKVVSATMEASNEQLRYANLYTGGNYRNDPRATSRTGYLGKKFIPIGANNWDKTYDSGYAAHVHLAWLRLADVYLMYAEAAAQGYGGANGKSNTFSMTAVEAVNKIRARAGVANVADKFTATLEGFMSELRRERAVELAFEGHRFNDLRRWLLLTEYPYNVKTSQEFDRVGTFDPDADPNEAEVANYREEPLITRNLTSKHYWLPLKTEDVSMYPEFYQNPGW
jgi:hypothetical protein